MKGIKEGMESKSDKGRGRAKEEEKQEKNLVFFFLLLLYKMYCKGILRYYLVIITFWSEN